MSGRSVNTRAAARPAMAASKMLASAATLLMLGEITLDIFVGDFRRDLRSDLVGELEEALAPTLHRNLVRVAKRVDHRNIFTVSRHDYRLATFEELRGPLAQFVKGDGRHGVDSTPSPNP